MILASAQTRPIDEDIKANLLQHYRFMELASQHGSELIVFPEMSITGYLREKALNFAFKQNDPRLYDLRQLSADQQITAIVGAPLMINGNLYIGAFIIKPDQSISIYTKQFLHAGEEQYFKSSQDHNPIIKIGDERISIAICADIDNPPHPENAGNAGTTIYAASLFFTPNGIPHAYSLISGFSAKYAMSVLMSNFCGQSGGIDAGGQSGFWDKDGRLVASLNDIDQGLLLIEKAGGTWTGKTIKN